MNPYPHLPPMDEEEERDLLFDKMKSNELDEIGDDENRTDVFMRQMREFCEESERERNKQEGTQS